MNTPVALALAAAFVLAPRPDDPALLRRELLRRLDARIDEIAARSHLEARLLVDEVLPIPYLGVDSEPEAGGLRVKAVYAETGAEAAGIRVGDLLRTMDGKPVDSKVTLGAAIRAHRVGDAFRVELERDGKPMTVEGRIGKRNEEDEDEDEQFPDLPPTLGPTTTAPVALDFESDALGETPALLETFLGGHGKPGRWITASLAGAPGRVLRQDDADKTGIRFPIALVKGVDFADAFARVRFRYASGSIDRAAGIVLRYQDPANYLVARANALETDVRIFRVANGVRKTLPGGIAKVETDGGGWHTLEFRAVGPQLVATVDGTATATAWDSYFMRGRVGLWTKSDGVSEFDDFAAEPVAK